MRVVIHLLATVILIPYFLLAGGFLLFGYAIAGGSLLKLFESMLSAAFWVLPLGLFVCVAVFAALTLLGTNDRTRWLASACVCVLAASSLFVIVAMPSGPLDSGQVLFLLPCALAAFGSGWIAISELRHRQSTRTASEPQST
jgi:hypothetical protein